VFKIVGDWQIIPAVNYELDFVRADGEVILRPTSNVEDKEFRVKWDATSGTQHLYVFKTVKEAIQFVGENTNTEHAD